MNIFVGNLSFDSTEADVKKLFEGFGNVTSVVIVMRKDKKAPKSRGFGFVEMPYEQQALAAMAACNDREFMGRVLNVNPARPKTEAERKSGLKRKMKPTAYKVGRRTQSYMKRHGSTGMLKEAKRRRKSQDNPMRWRKRGDQPKPWERIPGEHKPWKKARGEGRPLARRNGGRSRTKGRRKPGGYKR